MTLTLTVPVDQAEDLTTQKTSLATLWCNSQDLSETQLQICMPRQGGRSQRC